MTDELTRYVGRMMQMVDDQARGRMMKAAGMAAKVEAIRTVVEDLGADRQFSNWQRKVALGAGFDLVGSQVRVNHRPTGMWILADRGRYRQGTIYPRQGTRKGNKVQPGRAVLTPFGPRARSSFGLSAGKRTFTRAAARERDAAPKAAHDQLVDEIRRFVRST